MITYAYLTQADLTKYIDSDEFRGMPYLPISRHRAISHLHNPRLDPDDILLIIAYQDDEMLGYLGILPDYIFLKEKGRTKYGCLSCLWITPAGRGKGLGSILLAKGVEKYNGLGMLSDYVPQTYKIYEKAEVFIEPFQKRGVRVYVQMDLHKILPPKRAIFKSIKPILKFTDQISNAFLKLNQPKAISEDLKSHIEVVQTLDEEAGQFISGLQTDLFFKRGQKELNWMMRYPWVLAQGSDKDSKRYYFSSVDHSFDYFCLKIRNDQNLLVGFLMFMKRGHDLKLPYSYFIDGYIQPVIDAIRYIIQEKDIKTFTSYTPAVRDHILNHKFIGWHKKEIVRRYIFSKALGQHVKSIEDEILDGDGDDGFT